jgi:hypothetical protein
MLLLLTAAAVLLSANKLAAEQDATHFANALKSTSSHSTRDDDDGSDISEMSPVDA